MLFRSPRQQKAGWGTLMEILRKLSEHGAGHPPKSVAVFAPIFKDIAFEEEQEWRLVLSKIPGPMPAKQFRAGKSTLVPYVDAELQVKEGYFIKEVIVGPTPHPELSVEAAGALFQSLNHPEVSVRASNVPYRHW